MVSVHISKRNRVTTSGTQKKKSPTQHNLSPSSSYVSASSAEHRSFFLIFWHLSQSWSFTQNILGSPLFLYQVWPLCWISLVGNLTELGRGTLLRVGDGVGWGLGRLHAHPRTISCMTMFRLLCMGLSCGEPHREGGSKCRSSEHWGVRVWGGGGAYPGDCVW